MATRPPDPRKTITPEAFGVAPELLGLPLASPTRRALAMVCDLIPLAILIGANVLILAVAAAALLWRASAPSLSTGPVRRGVRALLRIGATVITFIIALRLGGAVLGDDENDDAPADEDAVPAFVANADFAPDLGLGMADLARLPDYLALIGTDDPDEARRRAARVRDWLVGKDLPDARKREVARELVAAIENPAIRPVAESVFVAEIGALPRQPEGDSAVLVYASALREGDTATARRVRDLAAAAVAGGRIAELNERVEELEDERADLRRQLARAEESPGLTGFIASIGDDLGIGFGWGAVYFTGFLALWRGYTPGKRLLGIRVIRLDGRPLGWWRAFERFGGYAASLSTGLLGFLQILWDRNRQGLHDKAAETVVVRSRGPFGADALIAARAPGAPPASR